VFEVTDDSIPTLQAPPEPPSHRRRWSKAIWIGAVAGLLIGMLAMVFILSMEKTPDVDSGQSVTAP
jgi:hypothetical protein